MIGVRIGSVMRKPSGVYVASGIFIFFKNRRFYQTLLLDKLEDAQIHQ
jgi:hypothetical protein